MMSKVLSTLSLIGVMLLMDYGYLQFTHTQQQVKSFVAAGPRFTSKDGQVLCERVKALEAASYGYRDAGKTPLACDYLERK